jgi:hypothetical protein
MRWSPGVPVQLFQELADWSIVWDGVANRQDTLEPKTPFSIALHDASLSRLVAIRVLDVIMPAAIRLPYIDLDALNGFSIRVFHGTDAQERLALGVRGHVCAMVQRGRVVRVEWSQDRPLGRIRWFRVVDAVN